MEQPHALGEASGRRGVSVCQYPDHSLCQSPLILRTPRHSGDPVPTVGQTHTSVCHPCISRRHALRELPIPGE